MMYSLPVMMLDTKMLNKIQWWAVQAILNKLGISKSLPCWVAFGPKDLCGMALLDMSVEQGIQGVQHFTAWSCVLQRLWLAVGNLMIISLHSLQLESGCRFHLLENPSEWVSYITSCWVTSIQEFLDQSNIKIKVMSTWLVHASQEQDRYIMHEIWKLGIYDNSHLFDLNAVRMHLKVTTLSDIVDAQGKRITEESFKGMKLMDL
jgi:hypothetical protein